MCIIEDYNGLLVYYFYYKCFIVFIFSHKKTTMNEFVVANLVNGASIDLT